MFQKSHRVCLNCGKVFYKRNKRYCSNQCQLSYLSENHRVTKICKGCGKSFSLVMSNKDRNFCSPECWYSSRNGSILRTCKRCGKQFSAFNCQVEHGGGKYCSSECVKNRQIVICKTCGKNFEALRSSLEKGYSKYCSRGCYTKRIKDLEQEQKRIDKIIATRIKNKTTSNISRNTYSSCKRGIRTIGNRQIFFRSRWEANYACYLQWLYNNNYIAGWGYEVKTFRFPENNHNVYSYIPDFKVVYSDNDYEYHEVKGWLMGDKYEKQVELMSQYYSQETCLLIDKYLYEEIEDSHGNNILGWEFEAE